MMQCVLVSSSSLLFPHPSTCSSKCTSYIGLLNTDVFVLMKQRHSLDFPLFFEVTLSCPVFPWAMKWEINTYFLWAKNVIGRDERCSITRPLTLSVAYILQLKHSGFRQISKNEIHPSLCNAFLLWKAVQSSGWSTAAGINHQLQPGFHHIALLETLGRSLGGGGRLIRCLQLHNWELIRNGVEDSSSSYSLISCKVTCWWWRGRGRAIEST